MSPAALDFKPDKRRRGWLVCPVENGALRVDGSFLRDFEALGLLDPQRWRSEDLPGVCLERRADRWVRGVVGERCTFFARYRVGAGRWEWLEDLLHGRVPPELSKDRAARVLEGLGLAEPRVLLIGEARGESGRESFLVAREPVALDLLPAWERLAPRLRALLGGSAGGAGVPELHPQRCA